MTGKHKNLERVRFLEGKRLFLTPESMDDFENHYRWEQDRDIQAMDGRTYKPVSPERSRKQFEEMLNEKDVVLLAIIMTGTGEHIGRITVYKINHEARTAEWGLVLDKKHWRQGLGAEASRLVLKYAFEDLGMRRMSSATNSSNVASARFQESLGCVLEGRIRENEIINGQTVDTLYYGLLRKEHDDAAGGKK
jgi:RimJ/RimL family protein N-acetyltransferase